MARYETVIGLEVHAQLLTQSKLFCGCPTAFGDEPNANVCPICAGMPGVLPVINRRAVEYATKMSLAVNCTINRRSIMARKNYFYPDLPQGYQISQYESPLAEHGELAISANGQPRVIRILRIHIENDAGKSIHSPSENVSFVDLNRAGVPLIEIVSQPDIRSPEEAVAYLKALRSILVYLGICDGNMEEGSFRCDANVSLRPVGQEAFGTRTEIKNVNSFRNVQRALEYEIARHRDLLDDGESLVQETRLWDAVKGVTMSMRGKEEAHDYRYFPDPDLMPVLLEEDWIAEWKASLPELPQARCQRFQTQYGLPAYDADVLTAERDLADYFERAAAAYDQPKKLSNWIMSELIRELNQSGKRAAQSSLRAEDLASLVRLVDEGRISGKIGKDIFPDLFATGQDPESYITKRGLAQISDTNALEAAVDEVLAACPDEIASYKAGNAKLIGFFVGQVMKKTKGQANPKLVNELLRSRLS